MFKHVLFISFRYLDKDICWNKKISQNDYISSTNSIAVLCKDVLEDVTNAEDLFKIKSWGKIRFIEDLSLYGNKNQKSKCHLIVSSLFDPMRSLLPVKDKRKERDWVYWFVCSLLLLSYYRI